MKNVRNPSVPSSRRVLSEKGYDPSAYEQALGAVYHYVRERKRKLSLAKAGRISGVSRQFWAKFEKGTSSVSTLTEVLMCNALSVRPSVMHRLAERWLRRSQKGVAFWVVSAPLWHGLIGECAWGM